MKCSIQSKVCLFASMLFGVIVVLAAHAEVKLPNVLGSHMVLQRDVAVPLWGNAEPDEKLTIHFDTQKISTKADANGAWSVKLPATRAGGPHEIKITDSHGNVTLLSDVLFGEVWVCSGQSNMEFPLKKADGAKEEIASADHPQIRLFTVSRRIADVPQANAQGSWGVCSPETTPAFSAVGYFFGTELNKTLNVPIGLIHSSWGGTPAESWTPKEALVADLSLQYMVKFWDDLTRQYDDAILQWKKDAAVAKAQGKPEPAKPKSQNVGPFRPDYASGLYNGMIEPLVRMPVAGAIWYQGERNVGRAAEYHKLFPVMIQGWRDHWHQPKMPFYFVEIAPYGYNSSKKHLEGLACAELWDAQMHTLQTVSNTGMAVINDVGNLKDVHPTNKKTVGQRLALWALAKTYGKKLVYSGPIYKSAKVEGEKIRIQFDSVGGGLAARDGKPLTHFAIAGEDEKFEPAEATTDGKSIVVLSDKVAKPVAVRFAWHETAEPNLINKEGLPASPFRTDNWKLTTEGKHL